MFGAFQTFGKLGAIGKAIAAAWSPLSLWPDGIASPGMWIDPSLLTASFNDYTGTTPVATPGTVADSANPVGLALDIRAGATTVSDPGNHMLQATSAARPVASGRKNLLVGTATLSTQSLTVTAIPHTITFSGGGTVTASGTYTGALTSGQTFTPTAGTLTLTVSGSVTSAQLELGSAATAYQAVVSDADYTATGFPVYLKFDGVDDALSSATFAAGTLTSSMDCLIAVRRDSAAEGIFGLYESPAGFKWFGLAQSGQAFTCFNNCGTPTVFVDAAQLSGGTGVTGDTLNTALTPGGFHIMEFRGLDLSAITQARWGDFGSGFTVNCARGDIMLYPSTASTEDKDAARQYLANKYGVTLA